MASDWDPGAYEVFAAERLRPALDLLNRIDLAAPPTVVDLGCGTGTVAAHILARWPSTQLTGIDVSAAMLAEARRRLPGCRWVEADLAAWSPDRPVAVVFSNAALHWADDHERLFPKLVSWLVPGGVLAVQMPRSFSEPVHAALAATVGEGPWRAALTDVLREAPVAEPVAYFDMLAPLASTIDVWETLYFHRLFGAHPVFEWARGTALRPVLARLPDGDRDAFLEAYRRRLDAAYPHRPDGSVVLPFRRLFIVARR